MTRPDTVTAPKYKAFIQADPRPAMGDRLDTACQEIAREIESEPSTDARRAIIRACARHSLPGIPSNRQILARLPRAGPRLRRALASKPVRTGSGVAVVTVMPMPYACPHGRCTYCPGGPASGTPNSYTGREPSAAGAMARGYDPALQVSSGLERLASLGHDTSKAELVVVGGTSMFMPPEYRRSFAKSCYDALNGRHSPTLEAAQLANESATSRSVGFSVETKPDWCRQDHIDDMLEYGVTRVELGVQSLRENVLKLVNRGHGMAEVVSAFRAAKDSGYKLVAHMMPGLPTASPEQDLEDLINLFEDPDLRPDMLKIYPALAVPGTRMHEQYRRGEYAPYPHAELVRVLAEAKSRVPPWVRIMRIQREMQPDEIAAGPRYSNLRQEVHRYMKREGLECRCIRCREAASPSSPEARRVSYRASGGTEHFISMEGGGIQGFVRVREPGSPHRPELRGRCAVVRELHVYGRSLPLGERGGIQHRGLGARLMAEAEGVARESGAVRMLVLSAVGTRAYYRRLGYERCGPYMARDLR